MGGGAPREGLGRGERCVCTLGAHADGRACPCAARAGETSEGCPTHRRQSSAAGAWNDLEGRGLVAVVALGFLLVDGVLACSAQIVPIPVPVPVPIPVPIQFFSSA